MYLGNVLIERNEIEVTMPGCSILKPVPKTADMLSLQDINTAYQKYRVSDEYLSKWNDIDKGVQLLTESGFLLLDVKRVPHK